MEDFNPSDIALDYGYYQGHSEAWLWVVLAVGIIVAVQWALSKR